MTRELIWGHCVPTFNGRLFEEFTTCWLEEFRMKAKGEDTIDCTNILG